VQVVDLQTNTHELAIPVDASLAPNAYCRAIVIRGAKPGEQLAAQRACGIIPIIVDTSARRVTVELNAPGQVRPDAELPVEIYLKDAAGAPVQGEVTLAAIDEGICRLTRMETPDPFEFFHGKRRLAVAASDIYSLLMPEVERAGPGSDSEAGGDGPGAKGSEFDPRLLNPIRAKRIRPVALWQSNVETDADGRAAAKLHLPQFIGSLRIVAVAATADSFGAARREVCVRAPLMVESSFPRFLAPDDSFTVPLTVTNNTGRNGAVDLTIETSGGLAVTSGRHMQVEAPDGSEQVLHVHLQAPSVPGVASAVITAALGGERAVDSVELAVRPPATLQFVSGGGALPAGRTADIPIPGDWVPGSAKYSLTFSPMPAVKLAGSIRYLVRYPYGCVEQTTSAAFPLLYLADVAEIADPETFAETTPAAFAQAGVDRICSMQTYDGGLSTWIGGRQSYPWGSVYATHFLVEARKAGYHVPEWTLNSSLNYLNDLLRRRDDDASAQRKAYACYVLALAGKPDRSWTLRLYENRDLLPAYSRFQVAVALALMNERDHAAELVTIDALPELADARDTEGILHSSMREAAILLSAYMDVDPDNPNVPALVRRLEEGMQRGRWATTQENGFALVALGKYIRSYRQQTTRYDAQISVGNTQLASFTHDNASPDKREPVTITPADIGGSTVRVAVNGTGVLHYYWSVEGIPLHADAEEKDSKIKVRRRLLSSKGEELDPQTILQGEMIVVEIEVENRTGVNNLVINDLLPAGLEIENPRIATRDSADWLRTQSFVPDRTEMRDDRMIIFANLPAMRDKPHVYRYVARAVTCGRFRMPAINAFCMYDPDIVSINGAGTMVVSNEL